MRNTLKQSYALGLILLLLANTGNASPRQAGLLFGEQGIEPGDPAGCEAKQANRCWYVDAAAADGGNGSLQKPFNSFEQVVGYRTLSRSYVKGLLNGGDHLYLTGTFYLSKHIDSPDINITKKSMRLIFGHPGQSGTPDNPTLIKSYKGKPRAVLDGEFKLLDTMHSETAGLIHVSTSYKEPMHDIVIQNIEVRNAAGLGIAFVDNVSSGKLISVVVHDTALRDGASSSGGIHFRLTDRQPLFSISNSLIYHNYRNEDGSCCFIGSSNNIGGINILTEPKAQDGSKVIINNNIIKDELYAIRHKRSGNIITEAANNIIENATVGFYIRGYKNNIIHHNLIKDTDTAILLEAENQKGNMQAEIFNNTVINAEKLIDIGYAIKPFKKYGLVRNINLYKNVFTSKHNKPALMLGESKNGIYPLDQWQSANNLFMINNKQPLLRHEGNSYTAERAFKVLNDPSSVNSTIKFKAPERYDYSHQRYSGLGAFADDSKPK